MDNISFCFINRRMRAEKAGQFKKLSGFLFCRFFMLYANFCHPRAPPFSFLEQENQFQKGKWKMEEEKKYYISLEGKSFEVSRELYAK